MAQSDDRETGIEIFKEPVSANEESSGNEQQSANKTAEAIITDHQLLNAYSQGDEKAFEALIEKYFRMVYTVAARQTGDSHLAEEIAQSVFLVLSRKARGFSSKSSIPGWLLRTTRFVCWDAIKMRRRREQKERKFAVSLPDPAEARLEPSTMEALLDEALRSLSPDEQAGIFARFFDGKDFREMAQMFAITEHAARKRTSRCLAKLQSFMQKRRTKVSLETLSGLLIALPTQEAGSQAFQSAIAATHAVWKGTVAAGNAATLANHAMRLLRWRFLGGLGLKFALPALILFIGAWSVWEWHPPASQRINRLGKSWGLLAKHVMQHRQYVMQTPPNAPNYYATVQAQLDVIVRENSRIMGELKPLIEPPDDRKHVAAFLIAELADTLKLNHSQKINLSSYIQNHLAQGATLHDAMFSLGKTTRTETAEIKAMLSPVQQQLFDQVYGADGVLLFSYAKVTAVGIIEP